MRAPHPGTTGAIPTPASRNCIPLDDHHLTNFAAMTNSQGQTRNLVNDYHKSNVDSAESAENQNPTGSL